MFVGGIKPVGEKPPIKKYNRILPTKNTRYTPEGKVYKRLWDNNVIIDEIDFKDNQKLVIAITARDGAKYLAIRAWYYDFGDELWYPTSRGMTLPLYTMFKGEVIRPMDGLAEAITKVIESYDDVAIFDKDNQVWVPRKEKRKKK